MENVSDNNYMINDLSSKKEEFYAGIAKSCEQVNDTTFIMRCDNHVALRLSFISDKKFRVSYTPSGEFPEHFSYAIPEVKKGQIDQLDFAEKDDHYRFITERIICIVSKEGLRLKVLNKSGEILCEDEKGFHWENNKEFGGEIVKMSKKIHGNEHFYGLGDKSWDLDMRGQRFQLWGSDTYGYGKKSDPLYKNIPFYVGMHHKNAYGIFFDNSFRSFFDFGSERSNVSSFFAQGGEMDYYFIYGPEIQDVIEQYTLLTGTPELPPMWTLGFHQCKWSYYPEKKVREITSGFRDRKIPCDAIYLDIDYMEGFRCFTWSKEYFPKPKKMIDDFKKEGFKTVVIIDPGIKVDKDYWVYQEGKENDYFCKRADGPLMTGSVWPGLCNFPDYTQPEVREWWAGLFKGLIGDDGVAGVWNDMNEPAVFEEGTFPLDVRHDYDGHPCSHRKGHNVYGMQMSRATYHGVKQFSYPNRPFTITRSGYAGMQRYASVWTGDNIASWDHLRLANIQCQRLASSGVSFAGSDIGGFIETPSGEMFIRWIQLGIFHPFCRVHSSGDHGEQEPWSFGEEYTDLFRKFVELRYQMLPYIYSTFWQYVTKGTPMLRQIAMIGQKDNDAHHRQDEFGLGDHMIACPINEANAEGRWMYLPDGQWFYYWDDQLVEGGDEVWAEAKLDRVPLYIKAGAVIPFYPIQQYVGEKNIEELTLHVYHVVGTEASEMYEDAGEGYEYEEKDESNLRSFSVAGTKDSLSITQKVEGKFKPSYKKANVVLHGLPKGLKSATVDGKEVKLGKDNSIVVDVNFKEIKLG